MVSIPVFVASKFRQSLGDQVEEPPIWKTSAQATALADREGHRINQSLLIAELEAENADGPIPGDSWDESDVSVALLAAWNSPVEKRMYL